MLCNTRIFGDSSFLLYSIISFSNTASVSNTASYVGCVYLFGQNNVSNVATERIPLLIKIFGYLKFDQNNNLIANDPDNTITFKINIYSTHTTNNQSIDEVKTYTATDHASGPNAGIFNNFDRGKNIKIYYSKPDNKLYVYADNILISTVNNYSPIHLASSYNNMCFGTWHETTDNSMVQSEVNLYVFRFMNIFLQGNIYVALEEALDTPLEMINGITGVTDTILVTTDTNDKPDEAYSDKEDVKLQYISSNEKVHTYEVYTNSSNISANLFFKQKQIGLYSKCSKTVKYSCETIEPNFLEIKRVGDNTGDMSYAMEEDDSITISVTTNMSRPPAITGDVSTDISVIPAGRGESTSAARHVYLYDIEIVTPIRDSYEIKWHYEATQQNTAKTSNPFTLDILKRKITSTISFCVSPDIYTSRTGTTIYKNQSAVILVSNNIRTDIPSFTNNKLSISSSTHTGKTTYFNITGTSTTGTYLCTASFPQDSEYLAISDTFTLQVNNELKDSTLKFSTITEDNISQKKINHNKNLELYIGTNRNTRPSFSCTTAGAVTIQTTTSIIETDTLYPHSYGYRDD